MCAESNHRPELLAPAGDWEALRAAVANGADVVYFGLPRYSARQRAANFRLEELPDVFAYLHGHNVRGYVAFNTLIFPDEMDEAARFTAAIAQAGADAAIVQDLGLARLIHRMAPTLPLHASTQMTLTEPRGIELVRQLGIERVILARELSIEEIRRLRHATTMPLEIFVHGALCLSYSGQCLASESLWGRSANRGLCGQACRLPYRLLADGRVRHLGDKSYLLSTKDLAAYDRIADLVQLGVAGFKIEGRLKSACYVAVTTQVYRAAIDAALAGRSFALPDRQRLDLAQSYSRGFTHGFLDGPNHADLVHGQFPKSRGVRVGTVAEKTGRGVVIALDAAARPDLLKPGDGLVFDQGRPDEDEQGGRVFLVKPRGASGTQGGKGNATRWVEVRFGEGDVNLAAVAVGSAVWKTDDPRLRRELEKSYARDTVVRRAALTVRLRASIGQPLRIHMTDQAGNSAEVLWDQPLEPAEKRPLTAELVREQFGRLGDTPFELSSVELAGADDRSPPDSVMVPKSILNDLRRQAVAALLKAREARARHTIAEPDALAALRREIAARQAGRCTAPPEAAPLLYVLVRRPEQLEAVLAWSPPDGCARPALVYADLADVREYGPAVARCREAAMPAALATLRIAKPGEEEILAAIADAAPDAVLVRNLAALAYFRERAPQLPLIGDFSLNVANGLAADVLTGHGLARLTASLDLNMRQLAALLACAPAEELEILLHLHVPMMHMEHCVWAAHLAKAHRPGECGRPCAQHEIALRGRVGLEHPLLADARCRSTLFSGHVQSGLAYASDMRRLGLRHFRIEFVRETPAVVQSVLDLYTRALAGQLDGETAWQQLETMLPAVTRGTWNFE